MTLNRKTIGSYFALELNTGNDYFHNTGIRLNTGRNAFEYILRVKNTKTIFLPYYSCDALFTPLKRLGIKSIFYHINSDFYPEIDFNNLNDTDYLLYINYYGVCENIVESIIHKNKNIIIDNSQAFFSKPAKDTATFYSPRKFFGVPDGAFLVNIDPVFKLETDISGKRMNYLISRMENEPEAAFDNYKMIEEDLDKLPLRLMSKITERILSSVPYKKIRNKRKDNFLILHNAFSGLNKINITNYDSPLTYPLLIEQGKDIRQKLIEQRIFIPTYWPNLLRSTDLNDFEKHLVNDLVPLIIDQRYTRDEIDLMIDTVKSLI